MPILYEEDGEWRVGGKKHSGKSLEEVAQEDPSYLQWIHENCTESLSNSAFNALEDAMEEHDIEVP